MSSVMVVRALLRTVLLVKLVFMTAPTLRMLESDVKVCAYVSLNCNGVDIMLILIICPKSVYKIYPLGYIGSLLAYVVKQQ